MKGNKKMNTKIQKLVQKMGDNFEGALITSEQNRFYLLGMKSSAGTLLVLKDASYFIIDFRYIELAKKTAKCENIIMQDKLHTQINEILKKHNVKNLFVEDSLTVGALNSYKKGLDVNIDINSDLTKEIMNLRKVKDEDELKAIAVAQEITDETLTYMLSILKAGVKERDFAIELDTKMKKLGAEGNAFSTILVSGENSSLPHGVPGDKLLEKGDFVTMDFGAKYAGYCTDMTRTIVIGSATDEMKKVYNTVLEAQLKALEGIKAGVSGQYVDSLAREHIYKNGYEGYFGHGLGHSFGIDVHENPRFSPQEEEIMVPGILMSVEPGIYLPGKFGVRIEDTICVTQDGHINLTKSRKDLIEL